MKSVCLSTDGLSLCCLLVSCHFHLCFPPVRCPLLPDSSIDSNDHEPVHRWKNQGLIAVQHNYITCQFYFLSHVIYCYCFLCCPLFAFHSLHKKFNLSTFSFVCHHSSQVHMKVVYLKFGLCFKNLSACIAMSKECIVHLLDILHDKLAS